MNSLINTSEINWKMDDLRFSEYGPDYAPCVEVAITGYMKDRNGMTTFTDIESIKKFIEERLNNMNYDEIVTTLRNASKPRLSYSKFYAAPLIPPKTLPKIKNVVFNDPLTVVVWADGTKTYVKASGEDTFDPEKGMALAIAKKAMENKYNYFETIREWIEKDQKRKAKKWEKEQKAEGRIIGKVVEKEATEEGVTAKIELNVDGREFVSKLKRSFEKQGFYEEEI